jgi:hypothetical protein
MPRILLSVMLFALAACSPEPEGRSTAGSGDGAKGEAPAYQRFRGRYEGASSRELSGMAGFCQQRSERFLILAGEDAGLLYFILPEHREWRTGDYAVNDVTNAGPDTSDPDVIYSVLMGVEPREDDDDVLYDTDVTSGTVHVSNATATHLTGTLRLNVRVRVNDPAGPSRTERATLQAAFDAYPVSRCPRSTTGG